jgi:hypothetical protein
MQAVGFVNNETQQKQGFGTALRRLFGELAQKRAATARIPPLKPLSSAARLP